MKKLTKADQKTLVKLLQRAVENNQIDIGIYSGDLIDDFESVGLFETDAAVIDNTAFDDGVGVGLYLTESNFKSIRGSWNRAKAVSRKLDSKTASEMAKKRHAKK